MSGKSKKLKKDDEETKSNFSFRKLLLDFVISEDSCHVSTVSVWEEEEDQESEVGWFIACKVHVVGVYKVVVVVCTFV